MSEDTPLSNRPVYLTADSAARRYATNRHLIAKITPDAHLLSSRGKYFPVWLPATVEAYLAGGAR
jgi:hypothetical protein